MYSKYFGMGIKSTSMVHDISTEGQKYTYRIINIHTAHLVFG